MLARGASPYVKFALIHQAGSPKVGDQAGDRVYEGITAAEAKHYTPEEKAEWRLFKLYEHVTTMYPRVLVWFTLRRMREVTATVSSCFFAFILSYLMFLRFRLTNPRGARAPKT